MLRTKFNITFIPVWLENTMARTGMNFSDALCKDKLLGTLSKNDVVFYLLANRLFTDVYLRDTVLVSGMFDECHLESLFNDEKEINQQTNIEFGTLLNKHVTPYTQEQLFMQHALGETIDMEVFKEKKYNFVVQLIDDKNIIVRFKFLDNDIPAYKFIGNFYEQLLRTLNFHYPFQDIAKTTLFGKYCRYLGMGVNK